MSALKEKIKSFLEDLENTSGLPQYISGPKNKKSNKIPKVLYSGPVWDTEELTAAIETIVSSNWLASGENVRKFEYHQRFNLFTRSYARINKIRFK